MFDQVILAPAAAVQMRSGSARPNHSFQRRFPCQTRQRRKVVEAIRAGDKATLDTLLTSEPGFAGIPGTEWVIGVCC